MTYPPRSQVYALGKGSAFIGAPIFEARDPTSNDVGPPYKIQQYWVNTLTQGIWVFQKLESSNGVVTAQWRSIGPVVLSSTAPGASNSDYPLGQIWIDTSTDSGYILLDATAGAAVWENFAGTGSNYPITPYVVGPAGLADYQTIQAAIDAAHAAGGNQSIWIQPGTYTEDLILYTGLSFSGVEGNVDTLNVKIVGTHTPPTDNGVCTFFHLNFYGDVGATSIFYSTAAGQAYMAFETCNFILQSNGYIYDMDNWVGPTGLTTGPAGLGLNNSGDLSTAESGLIKNSVGGMTISLINSYVGALSGMGSIPMLLSGQLQLSLSDVYCPIQLAGGTDSFIEQCAFHGVGITVSGSSTGYINNSNFVGLTTAALTMSSTGNWQIGTCTIETSNNPAIDGAGAGTLSYGAINFIDNASLAGTLTLAPKPTKPYSTSGTTGTAVRGTAGFSSSHFTVTDGFVELSGGGSAIDSFTVPAGTSPVIPDGAGNIDLPAGNGFQFTGGTNAMTGDMVSPFTGNFTFTKATSGSPEILAVDHTSDTAGSDAYFYSSVAGTSSGDPYLLLGVASTRSYSIGIDTSAAQTLKINTDAAATVSPSTGTEIYSLSSAGAAILPTATASLYIGVTSPTTPIDLNIEKSFAGIIGMEVRNDSTDPASQSTLGLIVNGSGANTCGNPQIDFNVATVSTWSLYIDNADSQRFKFSTDALGSPEILSMTTVGSVNAPHQPSVFAYLAAQDNNQTGDATVAYFGDSSVGGTDFTERFDQGNNFSPTASAGGVFFTCPVAGKYRFSVQAALIGLGAAHTSCNLVLENSTTATPYIMWSGNPAAIRDVGNNVAIAGTQLVSGAASDLFRAYVSVSGSTKTVALGAGDTWIQVDLEE